MLGDAKYAGNINMERIITSDDAALFIRETAEANAGFAAARRGAMTFEEIENLAAAAASLLAAKTDRPGSFLPPIGQRRALGELRIRPNTARLPRSSAAF